MRLYRFILNIKNEAGFASFFMFKSFNYSLEHTIHQIFHIRLFSTEG